MMSLQFNFSLSSLLTFFHLRLRSDEVAAGRLLFSARFALLRTRDRRDVADAPAFDAGAVLARGGRG